MLISITTPAFREGIRTIHNNLMRLGRATLQTQLLCLAEEVGEVMKEGRTKVGMSRKNPESAQIGPELADVVISAYVTAAAAAVDLDLEIWRKLIVIRERGGV